MSEVAIYARCAVQGRIKIKGQVDVLSEFAQKKGFKVMGTYTDNGRPGTTTNRSGLIKMLEDAKSKKFDTLICTDPQRLYRGFDAYVEITKQLKEAGVKTLFM